MTSASLSSCPMSWDGVPFGMTTVVCPDTGPGSFNRAENQYAEPPSHPDE